MPRDTTLELVGKEAPASQKNVPGKHRGSHVRVSFAGGRKSWQASGLGVSRDVLFKGVDGARPCRASQAWWIA